MQANSLLGMCSYTVRQARSGTGATPDAFTVGSTSATVGTIGAIATKCTNTDGFAWLTIPNSAVTDPSYCGAVLTNTDANTSASPVTGKIIFTIEKIGQARFKKL